MTDCKVNLDETQDSCPICLDVLDPKETQSFFTLPCDHTFHLKCIRDWCVTSPTCPLCRTDIKINTIPEDFPVEQKKRKARDRFRPLCTAQTRRKQACKNYARFNQPFCHRHIRVLSGTEPAFSGLSSNTSEAEDVEQQRAILRDLELMCSESKRSEHSKPLHCHIM